MSDSVFTGCMPALMTPCTERSGERAPDFDALAEKGKQLVDAGMSGVVYCGSMGDWPLLTDAWRMEGVSRLVQAGSWFPPSHSRFPESSSHSRFPYPGFFLVKIPEKSGKSVFRTPGTKIKT